MKDLGFEVGLTPTQRAIAGALGVGKEWSRRALPLQELDEDELWKAASENDLESQIAHVLMETSKEDIDERWSDAHRKTFRTISGYLEELERVGTRLQEAGIPLVALKNAGIARFIHDCPGCCPMGDIDVLIKRDHFFQAHEVLTEDNYQFGFRSPLEQDDLNEAFLGGGAEYKKTLPVGTLWLELQWRPVAGRWIQPEHEPSADELIERASRREESSVMVLDPVDNLLQVCLHTAKHSYVRAPGFRLHTDADRICCGQSIDWETFVADVKRLHVKTACYFSLAIPHDVLGTPIPEHVLTKLRPTAWKRKTLTRSIVRAGLFGTDRKKFGRLTYIMFTILLFDGVADLWRGVFPSRAWMRERYRVRGAGPLTYHYARRLVDLALRRVSL